uniref:Virion structural protein n=1 Tax=Burkholderia phage vB_BgluM-SURPRISE13 TaxID=3159457 RepID=A0AAU7PF51_9VIRU
MIIDSTPLDFEIQRVLTSSFTPNYYSYTGQFKVGSATYDVIKITDLDEHADFELNFGAVKMIRVVMMLGDWSTKIYPARGSLEFILKTELLNPTSYDKSDAAGSVTVETFNVSIDPKARPFMSEDNNTENLSSTVQNLMDFVSVDIQLKPKLLDDVSKVTVGGNHTNTTTADVIKNAITHHCSLLDLDDDLKLLGVDMHPSASTDKLAQVVVDHGVMLSDLADYVHKKAGGVFPSGMAQYVHDRVWHVYPPYDTAGFDDAKEKFIIISVPAKRYPQVEKTYLTQNGITTILSTGNKKIQSDKSQIQDNAGNGVMFADANQIVQGFSKDSNNTALVRRSQNNSEFVGEQAGNGKNNVRMSPEAITANPYLATSRLARSQGHYYTLEWENADPTLIKPGLSVKIMFLNEGDVKEVNGKLLKAHINTKMNGQGLLANGFRSFIALVIFVRADEPNQAGLVGLE